MSTFLTKSNKISIFLDNFISLIMDYIIFFSSWWWCFESSRNFYHNHHHHSCTRQRHRNRHDHDNRWVLYRTLTALNSISNAHVRLTVGALWHVFLGVQVTCNAILTSNRRHFDVIMNTSFYVLCYLGNNALTRDVFRKPLLLFSKYNTMIYVVSF